jgi:cytochrome c biogenesis protein ResB
MLNRHTLSTILLKCLSSAKLALVLVLLIILFSVAGAVLPQEGRLEATNITQWQQQHPMATRLFDPLGLFHVFHSWPFMIAIMLLAVNTLTCTALRFVREGGIHSLKGPDAMRRWGFLLLHLSFILLFAGAFFSAAARSSGYIVLTEGQSFTEQHDNYVRIVEGPLRSERHKGFVIVHKEIQNEYSDKLHRTGVTSYLEIISGGNKIASGTVEFNRPFVYEGRSFTLDETGYSPRLKIYKINNRRPLFNSFVALQTFKREDGRRYHDFLPMPFFKNKVLITLYPAYELIGDEIKKTGENPENPLILIEMEDDSGNVVAKDHAALKEKVAVGDYEFEFAELRQWAAFQVSNDPGYPVVCVSLWLGLIALILRYLPDLRSWFTADPAPKEKD